MASTQVPNPPATTSQNHQQPLNHPAVTHATDVRAPSHRRLDASTPTGLDERLQMRNHILSDCQEQEGLRPPAVGVGNPVPAAAFAPGG